MNALQGMDRYWNEVSLSRVDVAVLKSSELVFRTCREAYRGKIISQDLNCSSSTQKASEITIMLPGHGLQKILRFNFLKHV